MLRRHHRIVTALVSTVASLVALLLVVLGVGGLFAPARYLDAWSPSYHEKFTDPRMQLVSEGLLASSGHNMQPWLIALDKSNPNVFELYADPSRLSTVVDPLSRQVMVSQGAFLEYVRVAGEQLGHPVSIELFPNGQYNESALAASMANTPVARVTLSSASSRPQPVYDSMFLSDTNRAPYTATPPSAAQLAALGELDSGSTATLSIFTSPTDLASLGQLAIDGSTIEAASGAATAESDAVFRTNDYAKNAKPWGFAVEGQGTSGFMKYLLQGMITIVPALNSDDVGATRAIALTTAAVAATPAYGMISTPTNTRTEQVEAGMLYSRFDLSARSQGLVMQPLSQVLQEYPSMAAPYSAIHAQYAPAGQTIQMLVRFGNATVEYPQTIRRGALDLIRP